MCRAYHFRMYSTTNQRKLIQKTFGCTRLVYTYYLKMVKTLYEAGNLEGDDQGELRLLNLLF